MNKKIVLGIFIIMAFIILIIVINKKQGKVQQIVKENSTKSEIKSDIIQDSETEEYVIYDEETGEEIARSMDKESLHIYEIDPDYNPKTPISDDEPIEQVY